MSKFQYELGAAIRTTLEDTLRNAQKEDDYGAVSITVNSESLIDQLNRQLASMDGTLPQVQKKKGTVSTYVLKASSYEKLKNHFNLEVEGAAENG